MLSRDRQPRYAVALVPWRGPGDRFLSTYRDSQPLHERIKRAASLGVLQGVELMYPSEVGDQNVAAVNKILADHDLSTAIIGTPISSERQFAKGTLTSRDPAVRRAAVDRVKEGMDISVETGCNQVMFFLGQDGCDYSLEVDYEDAWNWMIECVIEMADHRPDVRICIEYKPFEPRRHIFLNNVGSTIHFIDQVGAGNLGVVLDTGHAFTSGEMLGESIWLLHQAGRLFHLHFNDNYRGWDDDMVVGSVHFLPFIEAVYWLKRIEYRGWHALDLFPYREDPDLAVQESVRFLQRLDDVIEEIGLNAFGQLLKQNDGAQTMRFINRQFLEIS